ncbi:MAG: SemiSWEET transporter [Deltaproteobacteria bacterium]|nr:SemiSWEET transporter [Deltaproteobacteria bacterium]
MEITTLLGLTAATLTTLSFVPQVVKTWKMRETRDISLFMFVMLAIGIVLWTVYGFIIQDLPVILANCISFILTAIIIYFKVRYK